LPADNHQVKGWKQMRIEIIESFSDLACLPMLVPMPTHAQAMPSAGPDASQILASSA
jgi:hypothetical protein